MRSESMVQVALALSMAAFAVASPIEDLASPDQKVRDKAASAQRGEFKPTPESTWTPIIAKISKGQSKKEILELLRPFNVTEQRGPGSGQSHSVSIRLDDEWLLVCSLYNDGDILIDRELTQSMKQVWVALPKDYSGQWVLYFVNGNKSHEINLKNGRYFGEFIAYYSNGAKCCVQHYTESGAEGDDTGYHPSGTVAYQGRYKENKQVGTWTWYDETGKVTSTRQYP